MKKFKLFAVTAFLLISAYSFAQWTFVGGVTGAGNYPSISVAGTSLVFISGGNNTAGTPIIFKSTNGGVIFTPLSTTGISYDLMCIWGVDANKIYCGDGGGIGGAGNNPAKIYLTTNSGVNWSTALTTSAGFFNGIVFSLTNPNSGWALSDGSSAGAPYWGRSTTDGGTNWIVQSPPAVPSCFGAANSPFVIDNQFFGFGTSSQTVFTAAARICVFTSNGGTTWNTPQLPGTTSSTSQSFINAIAFNSNKIYGLAAGSPTGTTISRTTNGGSTWASLTIPSTVATAHPEIKYVPNSNTVYLICSGTTTQSFKSTNNGTTWTSLTWPAGVNNVVHSSLYYSGGSAYIYAVCSDGSVVKLVDVVTDVNTNNTVVPSEYKLEQNYPNPFNPVTNINYSIPKSSYVTLKIYDVLGNEVMTAVDGFQVANNYTQQVSFSKLSSGTYFYTLKAGDFTSTKKLTLMK